MNLNVGDINFADYDCYVFPSGTFAASARQYDKVSVPGRSGDLLIDKKVYPNRQITYTVIFMKNFMQNFFMLRDALTSQVGYQRIVDSINPEYYRMGYLEEDIIPTTNVMHTSGKAQLTFSVKPQRYLFEGDEEVTATSIYNATNNESFPIICVSGYGTIGVGEYHVEILENSFGRIEIDCETMNAIGDGADANSYISFLDGQPVLSVGANGIEKDNTVTSLSIVPRWWLK